MTEILLAESVPVDIIVETSSPSTSHTFEKRFVFFLQMINICSALDGTCFFCLLCRMKEGSQAPRIHFRFQWKWRIVDLLK